MPGSAVASTSSAVSPGFAPRSAGRPPIDPESMSWVLGGHGSKGLRSLLPTAHNGPEAVAGTS